MLLITLASPADLQAPLPPEPSCSCTVSVWHGPCGFEQESCLCDDEYGWRVYRIYDQASGVCEEYRITLPMAERAD